MNGPIPILLTVRELGSGGIERDVAKLAMAFPKQEFTPFVAAFRPCGPRFEELTAAGIPILPMKLTSIASTAAVKAAWEVRRLIRQNKIQIVHSFDASAVFVTPIAKLLRVPVVLSSMLGSRSLLDQKSQKQLAFTDKLVDAVVVNCEAMRAHLVNDWGVPDQRIETCYNGVDTSEFFPAEKRGGGPIVIGTVCVLRAEKNLTLLQEAFAKLLAAHSRLKLRIVGSGPEREKLTQNGARLGIAEATEFIPVQQQVAPLMRSMDIFVNCSYSEAFSNSILEAMACGCCPVGSRVGGTPELIHDGKHGLLFASNDAGDLSEKLEVLIEDPSLRKSFGQRASEFARTQLSMTTNLKRNSDIYRHFLRAKKVIS